MLYWHHEIKKKTDPKTAFARISQKIQKWDISMTPAETRRAASGERRPASGEPAFEGRDPFRCRKSVWNTWKVYFGKLLAFPRGHARRLLQYLWWKSNSIHMQKLYKCVYYYKVPVFTCIPISGVHNTVRTNKNSSLIYNSYKNYIKLIIIIKFNKIHINN